MCIVPSKGRHRAFTLLEVVLGVSVLAILAGTMFTIVQNSLRATSEIEVIQRDNRRIERFIEVLRGTFNTLPRNANVELKLVETNPPMQELVITGAPEAFAWGTEPVSRHPITLALRRYPEAITTEESPEYYVGLHRPDFFKQDSDSLAEPLANPTVLTLGGRSTSMMPDERGRYWLPLLPSMKSMSWRLWNPGKKRWYERAGASRPPMIELTLVPYERNTPIKVIFLVR